MLMKRLLSILTIFALTTASSMALALPFKQIPLTEAKVQGYLAAQKDLRALTATGALDEDNYDQQTQNKLERIASKYGFSSFQELDDVAQNINYVFSSLDFETGVFTDPVDLIEQELENLKNDDGSLDKEERALLIKELTEARKSVERVKYKQNIDIVIKYRVQIEKSAL